MRRRVYHSFILLIVLCVLILSVLFSLLFHNAAKEQELDAVRLYASLMSDLLGSGVTGTIHFSDYASTGQEYIRITIIAPDGAIMLDSSADADRMENHRDRPEVMAAIQNGEGESIRYSDTLRTEMYYYAIRLKDGNILRVSRPVRGLAEVFTMALPIAAAVMLLVLVIANFAARKLTERVISPLEHIDFDSESIAVYDELFPYAEKIDRQKLEIKDKIAELSDRADTIKAITDNMKEGLILADESGVVLTANISATNIFGDNMEGKNITHIYRDVDFQNAVKLCLAGENREIRLERNGKVYSVFLSPVYSGGTAHGAVILFQDATERNRAEKQRREFSANVSHELKTPLTTISALSEMIEKGMAREDDVSSFAARISEQAGRLLVLINDIIRLSEFDEGGVIKEDTVFGLWELAETVIGTLKDNTRNVNIKLTGERFDISANGRMIDELLYNLIDNGVKYNKEGGDVTVELNREASGLCRITVSDTGIGILEQHQTRVFERFYRIDRSRSKKTGGTGLGLSIVKHISEYYNGRVELKSFDGIGTTVTCYLRV